MISYGSSERSVRLAHRQPVKNVGVCCIMHAGIQCFGHSLCMYGRIRQYILSGWLFYFFLLCTSIASSGL
jgi:hypothetical protein